MNHRIVIFGTIGIAITFGSLRAESPFARDLKQLADQRDKDLQSAAEPINRRYHDSLQQLLQRAMQAGDLDAALKIRAALGGSAATPAPNTADKIAGDWKITANTGYVAVRRLHEDGTGTCEDGSHVTWKVAGDKLVISAASGHTETFDYHPRETRLTGKDSDGHAMTLTKQ